MIICVFFLLSNSEVGHQSIQRSVEVIKLLSFLILVRKLVLCGKQFVSFFKHADGDECFYFV